MRIYVNKPSELAHELPIKHFHLEIAIIIALDLQSHFLLSFFWHKGVGTEASLRWIV